jgi:NAD(P)-dependent dehydrogenase (short-subunit alcohol dehydrogenase family)
MTGQSVALVTGCSSGIGRDVAGRMSASGYSVAATARRPETLDGLQAALTLWLDVTSQESVDGAIAEVLEHLGRIDVLVNNAGFGSRAAMEESDDGVMRAMYEVNVFGALRMMRAVAPIMRAQGAGRIVNMSSIAGRLSFAAGGGYASTKYALEALSDAAREELAPFGVHVILIEPGVIRTRFADTALDWSREVLEDPSSPYHDLYVRDAALRDSGAGGDAGPEAVSRVVLRALAARRPRARYLAAPPFGTRVILTSSGRVRDLLYGTALRWVRPGGNA